MTWFDFSLLGVLVLTTLFGVWNGLWWQVYRIISLVFAYILSVRFHSIGDKLCEKVLDEKTAKVVGCILVFVVVIGTTYLFGKLIREALGTKPGIRGRVFGGILGLAKGVLICSVVAYCMLKYNIAGQKEGLTRQITPLTNTFARTGETIAYIVPSRLRIGFQTFVTSAKTKEAVNEIPKMVNKLKQRKEDGETAKEIDK